MPSNPLHSISSYPDLCQRQFKACQQAYARFDSCPPIDSGFAAGAVVPVMGLPIERGLLGPTANAVLVSLPSEWAELLPALGSAQTEILVYPNVRHDGHSAYISISVPVPEAEGGSDTKDEAAPTVWLDLARIFETSAHNLGECGDPRVPLVFVAEQQFVVTEFSATPELLRASESALRTRAETPSLDMTDLWELEAGRWCSYPWPWPQIYRRVAKGDRAMQVVWIPMPDRSRTSTFQ